VWTPDGRGISFINTVNGVSNVWEQPWWRRTKGRHAFHFGQDFWFNWSKDSRLALSRGTDPTDAVLIRNFQ